MSLEAHYRRIVRLFPARWRHEHEDELIGTLLDGAGPGRESIELGEAIDLVRCAVVLHARGLRLTRFAGLALIAAVAGCVAVTLGAHEVPVAFLLTSLVVAAIPGTGVFYTVSSSIGGGRRRGLLAAVGCTLGVVPHLVAAMLGLSGVLQVGATVFEVIRWLGVAYLLALGLSMVRDRGDMLIAGTATPTGTTRVVLQRGILLNLLNPKLTLFFVAFLPQFLGSSPGPHVGRLIVLGGVFMLVTLAVFAVYAYASAILRDRVLAAPTARRLFQHMLGTLLIAIGARLALADR
jgi:threonine/homoserine/homoserine lactone efflux protein